MMMIQFLALCTLFLTSRVDGLFAYDRAAALMEQGKWQEAKEQLKTLLVDKPDSPDILYDAGIASYKTNDFKQARAYFKRVTDLPQTKIALKEQAYFNAGNAAAGMKEYDDAIKHFNEVLNINPANEKAKKNIEQIKLLKMQKQQQENNKDQKDSKENKEGSEAEQKNNQKNEQDQSSKGQDKKKQMSQDGDQNGEHKEGNEQQQEGDGKPQDQGQAHDEKQKEQAHETEQEKKHHEEKPLKEDKKAQDQGTVSEKKDQDDTGQGFSPSDAAQRKLDAYLVRVLDAQEKKDSDVHRKMVRRDVGQSMGGNQGENCW